MILAYTFCLLVSVVSFMLMGRFAFAARFGISLLLFFILAAVITVVFYRIGDRAPSDSITITPSQLREKDMDK